MYTWMDSQVKEKYFLYNDNKIAPPLKYFNTTIAYNLYIVVVELYNVIKLSCKNPVGIRN